MEYNQTNQDEIDKAWDVFRVAQDAYLEAYHVNEKVHSPETRNIFDKACKVHDEAWSTLDKLGVFKELQQME